MSSLSDLMKLQKKLDALSSMIQATTDFAAEISATYHIELHHTNTKLVSHLLEVSSQKINKLVRDTELNNPSLQSTVSDGSDSTVFEGSYCADAGWLQRKRAESAAEREKLGELQEIRERLAKALHYRPPSRSPSAAKTPETKGEGSGNGSGTN